MPEIPDSRIPTAFKKAAGHASPETLGKVRDIMIALAGLAGGLKIYPPEHASLAPARAEAWAKIHSFLGSQWELEFTVEENAFRFAGETVYRESNLPKSLPYLLFKDGLRSLTFRGGLSETEFLEFLAILRQVELLPPEEGDIVALLWEREFENISTLDSDDYLEAKIGAVERRPWEKPVDPAELAKGRIDLRPEDVSEIVKNSLEAATVGAKNVPEGAAPSGALDRNEAHFLETAFSAERLIPAEKSFLNLFFELLCLEDRPAALASMLQFADKHHQELLLRNDFAHAGLLLTMLEKFKTRCLQEAPIRVQDLERLIHRIKDSVSLTALREEVKCGRVDDAAGFFVFLERIGPRAIPLAGALFEEIEDGIFRSEAFSFLEGVGRKNMDALAGLASDSLPFLSKGVVNMLGRSKDRKAVPFLARFRGSKLKAVRLEAVKALTEIGDDLARKILSSFETDPDPEVREAARQGAEPSKAP